MYLTGRKKRAVRDQGQTSSKLPFLEVPASSCLRKSCKSPLPTPTQLFNPQFRRECKGAAWSGAQPRELTVQLQGRIQPSGSQAHPWTHTWHMQAQHRALYSSNTRDRVTGLPENSPHLESFHTFSHIFFIHPLFTHLVLHNENIPSVSRV